MGHASAVPSVKINGGPVPRHLSAAMIRFVPSLAPHLLLIDTCGASGTLALAHLDGSSAAGAGRIVATETLPGRSASERLIPAVRALLAGQGTTVTSVRAVAVVSGPGSFTGIRVGLSAAKGLVEALQVPLIALSRLAVLAAKAASPEAFALLDAGRGEFYCGHYQQGAVVGETLRSREEVLTLAGENDWASMIACEPAVLAALGKIDVQCVPEPNAADALPLCLTAMAESRTAAVASLDANYVRRTDAELFVRHPTAAHTV